MDELRAATEAVFRRESGRIIASLIRFSHSFDLAEEAMQDAFAAALVQWGAKGIPENPAAWITAAAQRKLIDYLRRGRTERLYADQLRYQSNNSIPEEHADSEIGVAVNDDRLSLIFTCCHPALNKEAQVALTLRTLGGLTTSEIARAFLIPEPTLAQRLVRAKRKIQQARIPYQVPRAGALPERLSAVQTVLYLIFNEGYLASSGDSLVRRELCMEAIRLTRILCELMPQEAENQGLLALMLLHDSRRDARVSSSGELCRSTSKIAGSGTRRKLRKERSLSNGLCRSTELDHTRCKPLLQPSMLKPARRPIRIGNKSWGYIVNWRECSRQQPSH